MLYIVVGFMTVIVVATIRCMAYVAYVNRVFTHTCCVNACRGTEG